MNNQISIRGFLEIALPMADLQEGKKFYQLLGYEVIDEQDWGMLVLKRDDSRVALLSQSFFKQPSVGYWTDNLEKVIKELQSLNIPIVEDDSKVQPPRITINDPAKNEIAIYQI